MGVTLHQIPGFYSRDQKERKKKKELSYNEISRETMSSYSINRSLNLHTLQHCPRTFGSGYIVERCRSTTRGRQHDSPSEQR